jgi:multidrug efflux pump subunit AcrA (membrane-fusion protein)
MRFLLRSLTALLLLAMTAGALALAGITLAGAVRDRLAERTAPRPAQERVYAAMVVTVEPGRVVPVLPAWGEVRARRTLDLRARQSGTVAWLAPAFEDGARVADGQVLVRFDPADAEAAVALAANDLARAEAELRDAGRSLALMRDELAAAEAQAGLRAQAAARQRGLLGRGVGSEAAVETAALAAAAADQAVLSRRGAVVQAEARLEQAANALQRQRIALSEAERALAETELRAGFDGVLSGAVAVTGGQVAPNERLAQIIDDSALEVGFRLSTAQYARLLDGSGALIPAVARVALDLQGEQIVTTARITRSAAVTGEGRTGRLVYAELAAPRGFRPGDFVTLEIDEPALDGVARLPAGAVDGDGELLVLGADDRLQAVTVPVLRRMGDAVVIDALAVAGREVVAERTPLLGAGIRVRPVRPGAAETAAAAGAAGAGDGAGPDGTAAGGLVTLTPERRAALIALVEASTRMPAEVRARLLAQLSQDSVPAAVIARIEARRGG